MCVGGQCSACVRGHVFGGVTRHAVTLRRQGLAIGHQEASHQGSVREGVRKSVRECATEAAADPECAAFAPHLPLVPPNQLRQKDDQRVHGEACHNSKRHTSQSGGGAGGAGGGRKNVAVEWRSGGDTWRRRRRIGSPVRLAGG